MHPEKFIIIYHKADFDGHGSGALVLKFLLDQGIKRRYITLYPMDYSDINNFDDWDIFKGKNVYMVDFTFQPYENTKKLSEICEYLFIIDHHKTAYESLKNYQDEGLFEGILDNNTFSAIEWTWKTLFKTPMPNWVEWLGRHDRWDMSDMESKNNIWSPFQLGMMSEYNDLYTNESWWLYLLSLKGNELNEYVNSILENGRKIQLYQDKINADKVNKFSFDLTWEGLNLLAMNTGGGSLQFKSIWENGGREKYDGMLIFFMLPNGQWHFSMYSDNNKKDLSEIAKKYGGGGHKGACGWICDTIPFLNNIGV